MLISSNLVIASIPRCKQKQGNGYDGHFKRPMLTLCQLSVAGYTVDGLEDT